MRKSSSDYQKELNELRKGVKSIKAHIKARLIYLIETFPDAIVVKKGIDEFKAKYITKPWLDVDTQISYIKAIEIYTESLEPFHQISMYD